MTGTFEDWKAICETKARYCRCLDTKDWDGWADVFTEDMALELTGVGGSRIEGRDNVVSLVRRLIETAKTAHHVHNPEIAFDADGHGAQVIWAMQDRVEMGEERHAEAGERGHTGFGHYRERYVKCPDGKWRIRESKLTYLHLDRH